MNNRVQFVVTAFPVMDPKEYIVEAQVGNWKALFAVFGDSNAAYTFAAAMNNAMDLADGHPRGQG